jgi:hypothetical protein
MVPIGLLASGGRKVRCARCKYEWHATLPANVDVFIPLPAMPPEKAFSPIPPPIPPTSESAPKPGAPPLIANLPAVINRQNWKRIILQLVAAILLLMAAVAWPILDRGPIVKAIPALRGFYESLGFEFKQTGQGLLFTQVKSELKYDSGTMRLYVDGVIHNDTGETQLVPDIKARAIGPDQRVIQSWWFSAPAATVAAGSDLPFHTEVLAPMKYTIENVSLQFYAEDEKGDVNQ